MENFLNRGILKRFSDAVAEAILDLAAEWGAEDFVLETTDKRTIDFAEGETTTVVNLEGEPVLFWEEEDWDEATAVYTLQTGMALLSMTALENEKAEFVNTIVISYVDLEA